MNASQLRKKDGLGNKGIKPGVSGGTGNKVQSQPVSTTPSKVAEFDLDKLCLWKKTPLDLEDAPETTILEKKPNDSGDDGGPSCFVKLIRYLKAWWKSHHDYGLANYKPIKARTNHNVDYVSELVAKYTKIATTATSPPVIVPSPTPSPSPKPTPTPTKRGSKGNISKTSMKPIPKDMKPLKNTPSKPAKQNNSVIKPGTVLGSKHKIFKDFYEVAYKTLQHLQKGSNFYKDIILSLTFTRYSEFKLTGSEIKLTQGKSIIGSCMWIVTCALKQLQEDPAIEPFEAIHAKPNTYLMDLASDLLILINLSFDTWNETVIAISSLERIHLKTEELFKKQTSIFHSSHHPDSAEGIMASVHLKKYRRSRTESLEIHRFGSIIKKGLTWNKKFNYPRILFKTDYLKPESNWKGFDPLPIGQKMGYLKELLKFVQLILKSVKESSQKIFLELEGSKQSTSPSFEKGLEKMHELLKTTLAYVDWTPEETQEFFEVDKIFLDEIDVLTMGAGLARTILHDARHTVHVCYETSRLLNFKEFISLPEYDKVQKMFYKKKDEEKKQTKDKKFLTVPKDNSSSIRRPSQSFDIEEVQLDLRNLNTLFRFSPYYEVVKTLPIYSSKVGLTLQDTDLVFTPSSERLLTITKPIVEAD